MSIAVAEHIDTGELPHTNTAIVDALAHKGWCVMPGFIPDADIDRLRTLALKQHAAERYRPAGIGKGCDRAVNREMRSDLICWIDPHASDYRELCGERFETLRLAINEQMYLCLFDLEAHYALYRPGAFYGKHLDQFLQGGRRMLTLILYLNHGWQPEDGGELLLYADQAPASAPVRILPHGGTLVCFMSELFPHEVLPARRDRLSLTGWYRTREISLPISA
jgi:SM-20-related protein